MISAIIVEDTGFVRELLVRVCSELELNVIGECDNGFDAAPMIINLKPDIVFLDLVLPEKNGVQVLNQLKEQKSNAKVIAMSSLIDIQIKQQALEAGAVAFLEKPFSQNDVAQIVEYAKSIISKGVQYG